MHFISPVPMSFRSLGFRIHPADLGKRLARLVGLGLLKPSGRGRGPSPQEEDSALRERHFPQMKAYHNLVCTAFNLPSHKVTVTLVSCPSNSAPPRAIPYPPDTQW